MSVSLLDDRCALWLWFIIALFYQISLQHLSLRTAYSILYDTVETTNDYMSHIACHRINIVRSNHIIN